MQRFEEPEADFLSLRQRERKPKKVETLAKQDDACFIFAQNSVESISATLNPNQRYKKKIQLEILPVIRENVNESDPVTLSLLTFLAKLNVKYCFLKLRQKFKH